MQNQIDMKGFIQIALVVNDIEKAAKKWAELFGVPVPPIRDDKPRHDPNLTYRGEEAYYGLKHGNGVHHLGFQVDDKRDAIVGELSDMGYDLRTVGYYPGSSWTIVDTEDDLGVNLNIKPKA